MIISDSLKSAGARKHSKRECNVVFCSGDHYSVMCFLQVRAGLEQISSFLSAHSREVVFLDFNHFYGVQNLHHEKLVAMLKEVFGDKLCPVVFAQEVLWNSNAPNAQRREDITAIG